MKKLVATILAFLSITACAFGLSACNLFGDTPNNPSTPHTHDYVFKKDDNQHYKECKNSGCDQKIKDKTNHDFTNGDCICGAKKPVPPHVHQVTKVEAVAVTCLTDGVVAHWHCAECGRNFADDTATTQIQSTVIPATGHTYDTTWSKDGDNHWYAATCPHTTEKKDEAPHDFTQGDCVCGQPHPHDSTNTTNTPLLPATCGSDGNIDYYKCNLCNKIFTDANCTNEVTQADTVIPATGNHLTPLQTVAVSKTCTTDGNIEYWSCGDCGKIFSDAALTTEITLADTVVKASHELTKTDMVTETCGTDGNIEFYTCGVCGKIFKDATATIEVANTVIPATGNHTLEPKVKAVEKTCTTDGNVEYYECGVCHKLFADENALTEIAAGDEVVPASHDLVKTEAVAENCGKDGNIEYWTCQVTTCGKIFSAQAATAADELANLAATVIAATGNHANPLTNVPAVAATCGVDGNIEYWKCDVCDKYFDAATVTTSPSNEITDKTTVVDAATGNHPDATFTYTAGAAKTCTTDGNVEYWTCGVCNKTYKPKAGETSTLAADHLPTTKDRELTTVVIEKGHELTKVEAVQMTCLQDGKVEHWHCSVCNKNYSDENATTEITTDVTIASQGHTVDTDNWAVDETYHWHEPSCGLEEHREDLEEHVYGNTRARAVSTACTVCGYVEGLKFQINADGTGYIFIGFEITVPNDIQVVVIPMTYNDKPVVSIGNGAFYNRVYIQEIIIPQSVVTIGTNAFGGCTGLIEIVLPESVTVIGNSVFAGCTGLTKVVIKGNVEVLGSSVFKGCINLVEVVLPDTIKTIGAAVFYGCVKLVQIDLPADLETVGANAFNGCIGLIEIILPNKVIVLDEGAFNGCIKLVKVVMPEGLQKISKNVFYGCIVLNIIVLPESLTTIGAGAFEGCIGLIEIILPQNLIVLGDGAFRGCKGLIEIIIPGKVENIGKYAFYDCVVLRKVIIREGVLTIGDDAFNGCIVLVEVVLPETLQYIKGGAFGGCRGIIEIIIPGNVRTIYKGAFGGCTGITRVEIKEGPGGFTRTIGEGAFGGCTGIIYLIIPKTITVIQKLAFSGCTGLPRVELPEGLKEIGDDAFNGCINLIYIYLPNTLSTLGARVFQNCTILKRVTIPRNVTKIGANVFAGCYRIVIYCILVKAPSGWDTSWTGGSPAVLDSENNEVANDGFIHVTLDDGVKYLLISRPQSTPSSAYSDIVPQSNGDWAIIDRQNTDLGGNVTIYSSVEYNGKKYEVGGMVYDAFKNCSELISVRFEGVSARVRVYVDKAFYGCTKLETIFLPNGDAVMIQRNVSAGSQDTVISHD